MARMRFGLGVDLKYMESYGAAIQEALASAPRTMSHVSVVGVETPADARAFRLRFATLPIIHHLSNIEPAGLDGLNSARMLALDRVSEILGSPWCGEDIGVWSLNETPLPYFAAPPYTNEMADYVASNIVALQRISSIPFLAEVPSVGIVIGDATPAQFFTRLSQTANCGIVLDLSHIFSHAIALRADGGSILEGFPFHRVGEIHVAGGWVRDGQFPRYVDSHSHRIVDEVFELLDVALPLVPSCAAVTYEVGASLTDDDFLADRDRLEAALVRRGFEPKLGLGNGH